MNLPELPKLDKNKVLLGGAIVLGAGGIWYLLHHETSGDTSSDATDAQSMNDVLMGGGGYGVGNTGITIPQAVSPYIADMPTSPPPPPPTSAPTTNPNAYDSRQNQVVVNAITTADPNAAYIAGLYQRELGRVPDLAGLLVQTNAVENGGTSLSDIAYNIALSSEYKSSHPVTSDPIDAQINALYESVLGRAVDAPGLIVQHQAIASGVTYDQLRQGLYNSAEYKALHPNG